MPKFKSKDGKLTVESEVPAEIARWRAEGFREVKPKDSDADAAKPEAPKSNK